MKYTTLNIFDHPINKNEEFQEAFKDFLDMRKKMKKPATERAVKLLILTLVTLAKDSDELAIKIIDQSIVKGYLDFYPLKDQEYMAPKNFNPSTHGRAGNE